MSKFVSRLSAISVIAPALLSISALRSLALSNDEPSSSITVIHQPQAFPPWTFSPITSTVPATLTSPLVRDIGEQGELVIEYYSNTVKSYSVVYGGTLTHMFSADDPAPGGGTFSGSNIFYAYAASPSLVYLTAEVNGGGASPYRTYRWSNNSLTHLPTQGNDAFGPTLNDAHGKFIFVHPTENGEDTEYRITDGVSFSDPITLHNDAVNDDPRITQQLIGITADGAFLIYETISSGGSTCTRAAPASPNQPAGTSVTRLFWLGSRSGTVVSGSYTSNGCGGSGHVIHSAVMNSASDILTHESTQAVPPGGTGGSLFNQLIVYPGNGDGPTVVGEGEQVGDIGPYFYMSPLAITEWRQPIFLAATNAQNSNARLYSGPAPASDAFDGDFIAGFGQDGTPLNLYQFSEKGRVLVLARLADNSINLALGHAVGAIEWIDPTGGNWNDGANWDGGTVPGSTAETLFNLEATYDVTVGTRTSGRSRIENGNVSFLNADLTLIGPLSIGGDAKLMLPEGTLNVGEITIGHLPPTSPLTLPVAQLYVSNQGTQITGSTSLVIGAAGAGELWLSDAYLNNSQVRIGVNSPGAAIAGGDNGA